MNARRRFKAFELRPDEVAPLSDNHEAVVNHRTIFPTTVVGPLESGRLLVSGLHSRKLGDRITKGAWKGFPIFHLTLEERATCPRSCMNFTTCYGNAMPRARRHRHDGAFLAVLKQELAALQRQHRRGFAVRLHTLGDFYSVDYVQAWREFLQVYPAMHVFGYTAHQVDTEIGAAIAHMRRWKWARFAIRTSDGLTAPNARTIWHVPEGHHDGDGIICPAETGATDCCATCGLCWSSAAKDKTIVFIGHGMVRGGRSHRTRQETQERRIQIIAAWNEDDKTIQDVADKFEASRSGIAEIINAAMKTGEAHRRRGGQRPPKRDQVPA